jgi:uncharacterized damage-inducible protein DinB
LIDRYASGGAILAYAAAGLTKEQERACPGPGDWSVAQLVAHLLDSDLVYADRMKRVIAEADPVLQAFDENSWVARLGSESMLVEEAVNLLAANRHWMTQILRRCSDADFARAGLHTEIGRVTLADLIAYVTNHVDHHLQFLYAKRSNLGVALPPRYGSEAIGA